MQMIKAYFCAKVTTKRYLIPVWVLKRQEWRRNATDEGGGSNLPVSSGMVEKRNDRGRKI